MTSYDTAPSVPLAAPLDRRSGRIILPPIAAPESPYRAGGGPVAACCTSTIGPPCRHRTHTVTVAELLADLPHYERLFATCPVCADDLELHERVTLLVDDDSIIDCDRREIQ